ncbi:MAG: tetratricopeptide repeat protein [Saezia sp.]
MQPLKEDHRSSIISEAKALINAAYHTPATNMRRFHLLFRWAKELLQPLADEGVAEAQWLLFSMPTKADKRISDEEFDRRRIEKARVLAQAGSIDAKFFLAVELDHGNTVAEASELFKEAAQQGHTYAKWCYGLNLLCGRGVEKNQALGLQYIEEAAHEKFEGAIQFLSHAYASGTYGYPKDEALAASWWAKLMDENIISY